MSGASKHMTWIVEVDWDRDGSYTAETTYVNGEGQGGFGISWDEDDDGNYIGSECIVTLRNVSGRYTRNNSSSAIYGLMQERVPIRIRGTVDSGSTYTRWTGYIMGYEGPDYRMGVASSSFITLRCLDLLAALYQDEVTVSPDEDVDSDAAYQLLLEAAGITSGDWSLGSGLQTFPTFYEVAGTLGGALQDVVRCELGGHHRCRADGDIVFEPRSTRLGTSTVAAWGPATNYKPTRVRPIVRNTVYDRVAVETTRYNDWGAAATVPVEVYREFVSLNPNIYGGKTIFIAANTTLGPFKLEPFMLEGPGGGAMIPIAITADTPICQANVDYLANDDGTSSGSDVTSSVTVSFELVDGAWYYSYASTVNAYIHKFTIRAIPVTTVQTHHAAESGDPGAGATNNSRAVATTTAWTNPGNVTVVDNNYATVTLLSTTNSEDLEVTDFGFTAADFPSGATPTGIIVGIEAKISTGTDPMTVRLMKGGVVQTNASRDFTVTTTEAIHSVGGTQDLFASTLTLDDILDSGFGVAICVEGAPGTRQYSVDHVTITVYCSLPASNFQERQKYEMSVAIPGVKGGKKKESFVLPWVSDSNKARDYGYSRLRELRYPEEKLELTFPWATTTMATHFMQLELGDQVTYDDTSLGVSIGSYNNDYYRVQRMTLNVIIGQAVETVVVLRPSYNYRNHDKIAWDDFNRADSASLGVTPTGKTWVASSGTCSIASKYAVPTATMVQTFDLDAADLNAEVSLSNLSADSSQGAGLVFRYSNNSNYWRFFISKNGATLEWVLSKIVSGSTSTVTSGTWVASDRAELRIVARGSRIRGWVDRKLVTDTSDSALSTNEHVGMYAINTTTARFKDFYVEGI